MIEENELISTHNMDTYHFNTTKYYSLICHLNRYKLLEEIRYIDELLIYVDCEINYPIPGEF
ncbi:hypothetical protein [Methanosphaera sp. BMS]|uniref:hypothetical protein n=1 Tax=Methanosphaera sp. BMS TaxID=1789762 RepID=UPI0013A6B70D|nr:hypothetical protein [Methanosphaera sp. BMS]